MVRNLVIIATVFALGVGVGSTAFGKRDDSTTSMPATATAAGEPATHLSGLDQTQTPVSADQASDRSAGDVEGADDSDLIEIEVAPTDPAEQQMQAIETRWSSLSSRLDSLSRRVIDLEQQLARREAGLADSQNEGPETLPIDTPEDRRSALVFAGVDRQTAQAIVSRESELAMERLDLRDRAAREGWLGSERFADEMRAIADRAIDLRDEVGDAAFDRFLYETGQPNRVAVSSVLAGSQGELAGILPGDIIEVYAGEPVFDFRDLRSATTAGTRDETVPVTLRRDDQFIETWMARGPIGVTLEVDSASPDW